MHPCMHRRSVVVTDDEGTGSVAARTGRIGIRPYTRRPVIRNRRALGCLLEIAETLLLTLIIFWVIQSFIAQPYRVEQGSMEQTLEENQYVLVDKLTPHFDSYSRGNIIVFNPQRRDGSCDNPGVDETGEGAVPFIKRVIGEPGDVVSIHDGSVFVNGVKLDEPYVFQGPTSANGEEDTWTVPTDRLFVMGDHRNNSTDSRSSTIGPICIRDVIGKAWLRYWPLDHLGILNVPTYAKVPPPASAVPGAAIPTTPVTTSP
jgi:signal peptidase I